MKESSEKNKKGNTTLMTENDLNRFDIQAYDGKRIAPVSVSVVTEVSVEIHLNDEKIIATACTGNHLDELAVGFLRSEGIITTSQDIKEVIVQKADFIVKVYATGATGFSLAEYHQRKTIAAGGARIGTPDNAASGKTSLAGQALPIRAEQAVKLMEELLISGRLHEETRGTHCSGLGTPDGLILIREDIGRHNTIDMLGGYALLNKIDLVDKILLTTGRISSEMATKAWSMGTPVLVSHSAPTSKALQVLTEAGITLIGYVRGGKMNIYTHHERVSL
jgi:FdhD protein